MSVAPLLTLRLLKTYQEFTLRIDAAFPSGVVALFGPSGSGKTTVLDCIAGLVDPDEGEIMLKDRLLFSSGKVNLPPEKRGIGYTFQDGLLFPHLKVKDNIAYGYKLTPLERRRIDPRRLVELLEIGHLLERQPRTLSSGERQRVALARALASSPDLLLLDEPLGALQASLRGRILRYLDRLHKELAMPMIYVSHSISEVLAIADHVLVLSQGRQLTFDKPRRALLQPFMAPLVDAGNLENILNVVVKEHRPESSLTLVAMEGTPLWLHQVDVPPGETISVSIRAADIIVARQAPIGISARNVVKARIEDIRPVGNGVLVHADAGVPLMVELTRDAMSSLGFQPGQDVFLIIKSSSIMVLD